MQRVCNKSQLNPRISAIFGYPNVNMARSANEEKQGFFEFGITISERNYGTPKTFVLGVFVYRSDWISKQINLNEKIKVYIIILFDGRNDQK